MATVTARIDDKKKKAFAELCDQFGLSMGTAITLWINNFLRTKELAIKVDENHIDYYKGDEWIDIEGVTFEQISDFLEQSISSNVTATREVSQ